MLKIVSKIDLDDDKTTDFEKVEKEDKDLALDIKKIINLQKIVIILLIK